MDVKDYIMMKGMIKQFVWAILVFIGIDFVWSVLVARKFYNKYLGVFERTINVPAVLAVYISIPLGLVLLVIPKAGGDPMTAIVWGAIYGLIIYGIYDLTNSATPNNWSATMVAVDMLWGTVLCGLTAGIIALI